VIVAGKPRDALALARLPRGGAPESPTPARPRA
jgi:hypothetical protein